MKVGEFTQSPYEQKNIKMADLQEEPSDSQVTIDLDFGSLVVKTKKLNRRSNLDINSPVGVAGIRGTEFQMAMSPNAGVDLDVTESVVAFTPRCPQAIPVSEGKGLSVSPNGVAVPDLLIRWLHRKLLPSIRPQWKPPRVFLWIRLSLPVPLNLRRVIRTLKKAGRIRMHRTRRIRRKGWR